MKTQPFIWKYLPGSWKKRMNSDPLGQHCPECFFKQSQNLSSVPCSNGKCLCHTPLNLQVSDSTKTADKFGHL